MIAKMTLPQMGVEVSIVSNNSDRPDPN
jgi:hypothetical protein